MPQNFETQLKGVLVTCVGFLASSLGVFIVRRYYTSSFHFMLRFTRFVEHTECHRFAAILATFDTQIHLYRRG